MEEETEYNEADPEACEEPSTLVRALYSPLARCVGVFFVLLGIAAIVFAFFWGLAVICAAPVGR